MAALSGLLNRFEKRNCDFVHQQASFSTGVTTMFRTTVIAGTLAIRAKVNTCDMKWRWAATGPVFFRVAMQIFLRRCNRRCHVRTHRAQFVKKIGYKLRERGLNTGLVPLL